MEEEDKRSGKDDVLATARKRFSAAAEAEADNRRNFVTDIRFSCAEDQWPEEVKRIRGRHRPMLTINRLNGVVKQIVGDYRQRKLAIKVLPASGESSVEKADILAGLIRNIEVQSNADQAYTNAFESAVRGGFGFFRIVTEYTGDDVFDQDIVIRPIHNPLTVYFDPSAKQITREDANWCFITEMMPKDEFKRLYPEAKLDGFDADDAKEWCQGDDVRVAEYFEKVSYEARIGAFNNGMVVEIADDSEIEALAAIGVSLLRERMATRTKIVWRKMSASQVLEKEREFKMRYIPIVPVIGEEVNIEGKVHLRSAIFYAKDPQKMYNYWKTAATESVALAAKSPWLLTPDQIQGFEEQWERANTTPSPYLLYNFDDQAGKPDRIDPPTVPIGEMTMANGASDDIKSTTGMYDASLGARGNETSGKAILARQQEGDTATYVFEDNLKKSIQYCGRILIDMIRITHDTERVVRVLDLEGEPSNVVINEHRYDPMTGVTEILNSITTGKYDVVIDTGPSFASRRQEGVAAMTQLAQADPKMMQVAGDLVIENMDFPGSKAIAERYKRSMPPEITTDPDSPEAQQAQAKQAEAAQMQQQMAAAQLQLEQAKIEAENAKSAATVAKAEAEIIKARSSVAEERPGQPELSEAEPEEPKAQHQAAPQVVLQVNPDSIMGAVAGNIEGATAQNAANTQAIAEAAQAIAQGVAVQGQVATEQTRLMQTALSQMAESNAAIAQALQVQNAIAAAPRRAVKDQAGRIIGSEVVIDSVV